MKILFGAVITSGRGKIGGQFVKRLKNGHSLNNLMQSKSKTYLRNFSQLQNLTFIFRAWDDLDSATKNTWSNLAALYPVTDKFGNLKNLNGRQFFTKCQSQGWVRESGIFSPGGFNTITGLAGIDNINCDLGTNNVDVEFTGVITEGDFYIRFDKLASSSVNAFYKNSKAIGYFHLDSDGTINFYSQFISKFPDAAPNEFYQFSMVPVNEYGWLGTPVVATFTTT